MLQYSAGAAQVDNVVFAGITAPTAAEGSRTTTRPLASPRPCSSSLSVSSSAVCSRRDSVSSATGPPRKLQHSTSLRLAVTDLKEIVKKKFK